jgi:uncharacterized protein YpuA (DUF1002 family)
MVNDLENINLIYFNLIESDLNTYTEMFINHQNLIIEYTQIKNKIDILIN